MSLFRKGHEVVVLDTTERSYKNWTHPLCKKPSFRHEEDIKVYSWWTRGFATSRLPALSVRSVSKHLQALWDIAVEKEGKPDVIYAHFTFPSGYCALALSQKHNIPLVVLEHGGMYLEKSIHPSIRKYLKETHLQADRFLCVSSAHKDAIFKWTGVDKEITVVPNMISNIFSYKEPVKKDEFVFFSAGNLKQVKRFDLLINAFSKAFFDNDKVVLKIAGEGELRQALETLINNSPCKDRIKLLGRLSRNDILKQYEDCDVFSLVSDHESFGVAYREALACGRPVISTANGGINDGWDATFGEIVPCGDEKALTSALLKVYSEYSRFSHADISSKTLDFCSEKTVMGTIERILESAVK